MFDFKITNDQNDEFEFEMYRRQLAAKVLLIFGLPTVSYSMIQDFIIGKYDIAFILLFMFLVLIGLFIVLRSSLEENQKDKIYYICFTLFMILFGTYLIYSIGITGRFIRIPWAYIFPLLVFLVFGLKEGLLWIFILYCGLAFSMFYFDFHPISLEELRTRFLISFFLISVISFLSAYLVRSGQRKLLNNQHVLKNEIKDREQAEQALRESEGRYRELTDFLPETIFECDLNGNLLFSNRYGFETFGYTQDDFGKGLNIFQMITPEDREKATQNFQRFLKGEKLFGVEYLGLRKDGSTFPALISSNLIFRENRPFGLRGIVIDITERKRVEEALRESEEKYRLLVENANEAIFVAQDGMLRFLNSKTTELIGYSKEELTSRPFVTFIHPEDQNLVLESYLKRIRGEAPPGVYSFRIVDKGGNIKWVETNVVLISWEGRPATLNFLVDITEHRLAEEKYRTIVRTAMDGFWIVDMQGRFLDVNDAYCQLIGYSRDELLTMRISDVEAEERPEETARRIQKIMEVGKDRFETHHKCKDGRMIGIEVSVNYMEVGGGRMSVFLRDITERKRTKEALRKSEEKFKEMYDNAPVGYHEYDTEGRITQVNQTELKMLGHTAEEMLGQSVWKFIVEKKSQERVKAKLAGDTLPGKAFERNYRRKDGTTFPVLIEDQLFYDEEGRIIGIRSTIQDITERKRIEKEMAALEEQLRQSQKIEAIGRLAGGIAHDFNNLLTIIKGYSDFSLLEIKEDSPLKQNIKEIQKASQRAADLTRQLLAFSRRQVMEMMVLDLNTLFGDLDKMLHPVIGEDIELVYLLSDDLGKVKTDPGQIEQVILNLVVNARDAMPSGGRLTIETANVVLDEAYAQGHVGVNPGLYVMLSVSDSGYGMSPEVKAHLFEPFFTTKEKTKGTGLGLSTVYGIVKQSEGEISVYSEPGQGTTFKIYLPRVDEAPKKWKEKAIGKEFPLGSETILVVEDELQVRGLVVRVLERQGYRVLEAANGKEALGVVQEHDRENIHLLLTDVVMPGMSGPELAEHLRSLNAEIRVLYMSGYTDNAIVHHGVLNPGIEFLQKPFSPAALVQKLREVLDR